MPTPKDSSPIAPAKVPSFAQLAVGQQLTSPYFFAVTSVFALANHFFLANDLGDSPTSGRALAVLAAQLVMLSLVAGVYLIDRRLGERRNPTTGMPSGPRLPAGAYFLIFLAAGAIRGAFLESLLLSMHFTAGLDYGYRIWVGATNFGFSAWIWAALFGLAAELRRQTSRLNSQRDYLAHLQTEVDDKVSAATAFEINAFREYLMANLKVRDTADAKQLREQLQHAITEVIQPVVAQMLSGRTAVQATEPEPASSRLRLINVLENVRVRKAILPLQQSILPLFAAAAASVVIYGWTNAVMLMSLLAVLWPILLWLVRLTLATFLDRFPYQIRIISIVAIFAFSVSPVALFAASLPSEGSSVLVPASVILYAVTTGVATGFWNGFEAELNRVYSVRSSYLQQIRWKVAEVNSRSWHQQLHFARRVHGSLQAEVAAMAIRLDKLLLARAEHTATGAEEAEIDQLRHRLEDRVRAVFDAPEKVTNLADVLTEIAETWEGICQITVHLADGDASAIAQDQIAVETVLEIVREGVSNAIRHGKAAKVGVRVELEDTVVRVWVSNDGKPAEGGKSDARQGMGSKHLQECTVAHRFEVNEGVTTLSASVPFRV